MYPTMCDHLIGIFGDDPNNTANMTCPDMRRDLQNYNQSRDLFELLHKYAKENLLWLNVYVKDSFATRIIRDERMTRTSFVANVGGLLGLCMGFSLVSVAEILYFCLKRNAPCTSFRKKSKWEIFTAENDSRLTCTYTYKGQITLRIVGYHFSSRLTATLNLFPIYLKLLVLKWVWSKSDKDYGWLSVRKKSATPRF